MKIEFNALDSLFFKDGKPFSSGLDNWADGMFPPSPSVFYGALRSLYFSQNMNDLSKANQPNDPTKELVITSVNYAVNGKLWFPIPMDLVEDLTSKDVDIRREEQEDKRYKVKHLHFFNQQEVATNAKTPYIGFYPDKIETLKEGLISENTLFDYKNGELPEAYATKFSDYLLEEPKIGIARDKFTHTAAEGKLYRVGLMRIKDDYEQDALEPNQLKIVIDFEGLDLDLNNVKLGAEGKIAQVRQNTTLVNDFKINRFTEKYFKLVLHTPSIFTNDAWKPDQKTLFEERGIDVELISAIVGKPLRIGGFDMAKRQPKPMFSAVPAGSVYYYKAKNKTFEAIHEQLKDVISVSNERTKEGFGLFSLASVDFEQLIYKKP